MKKSFVRGTWQKSRAFSPAVITEGGKVIWIAGHTGQKDPAGNSLAGDFEAQMRQTFKNIETTLKESGASLKDIVTMTVFLADSRYTTPIPRSEPKYSARTSRQALPSQSRVLPIRAC
jgi:2-iminobutanoate/2-iminopropanoate deaminase